METESKKWIKTIILSSVIFIIFSIYLVIRRGYFNLYIANKVFGSTAVVLAGVTLILGPLSKKYQALLSWMMIRKHLGLAALGLALFHIVASLLLQNKFPFPKWYVGEWLPVAMGLLAISIWIYIVKISTKSSKERLGMELWGKQLSLAGRVAFYAIFLHLVTMKYHGWITWFEGKTKQTPELANPQYPPASLFVFLIMLIILLYRAINGYFYKRKS